MPILLYRGPNFVDSRHPTKLGRAQLALHRRFLGLDCYLLRTFIVGGGRVEAGSTEWTVWRRGSLQSVLTGARWNVVRLRCKEIAVVAA